MRKLRNYLLTGIIILLPLAVTVYVIQWLFNTLENSSAKFVELLIGREIPGLGALFTLIIVLLAGLLTTNILGRKLIELGETLIGKIPIVNSIYKTVKQLVESFARNDRKGFQQVVLVEYPRKGMYALAFVTGTTRGEVQEKTEEELVNVFLPTTPNPTSGFLLLVPRDQLIWLDMSVEDGVKMIISAGVITPPYPPPVPAYKRER